MSMRRREFIAALGGMTAVSMAARTQDRERLRHIGALMTQRADDPDAIARISSFAQGLQALGWTIGRNVGIEYRWTAGDAARARQDEIALAQLKPDVILNNGAAGVTPVLQATRTVPVVFVLVADPVGAGFVDSMARPGGNATGFTALENGFGGKYLEVLKEIAPHVTRTAVVRDPTTSVGIGLFGAIQSAAPSLRMETTPINVRDAGEIERALIAFASMPNGGLVVTASPLAFLHRELIVSLAARYKLPAIYPAPGSFVGGLVSFGTDTHDQYRLAAGYVDRILKGEKPADLPVQAPTKYVLTINLKTAKVLGLTVPPSLLARADEVIE
jgi:putative ABC transport system substrate-binding protein